MNRSQLPNSSRLNPSQKPLDDAVRYAVSGRVKFPYWGVLNYADSLCIKISPIFYIANPNPNPTGPTTAQYGNDPTGRYS